MTEPSLPNSYPFQFDGGLNNIYSFVTINEVSYEVHFVPSAYMFGIHRRVRDDYSGG